MDITINGLTFDSETHTYRKDGTIVPHITGILEEAGLVDDFYYTEKTSAIGKAIHTACRYLDEEELDWDSLDSEIVGRVKGYDRFLKETGFKAIVNEEIVFSELHLFAGTLDKRGFLFGEESVVELKSGPPQIWARLQTAGQNLCLTKPLKRYVLELRKNEKYKLHPNEDDKDHQVFLAALAITNWRRNHK